MRIVEVQPQEETLDLPVGLEPGDRLGERLVAAPLAAVEEARIQRVDLEIVGVDLEAAVETRGRRKDDRRDEGGGAEARVSHYFSEKRDRGDLRRRDVVPDACLGWQSAASRSRLGVSTDAP